MRSIFFLLAIVVISSTIRCSDVREKTAEEILEKPKMRDEIYSAILNDRLYFKIFMNKIMSNETSKQLLADNYAIMKMMCMSDQMDKLISTDNQAMEKMANRFIFKMEEQSGVCDKTCVKYMPSEHLQKCIKGHMCNP